MLVWQRLLDAIDRHGKAAMATVIGTRGSAPREAGARIVVLPDASFFGTIGGGTLEWRAIADLQAALARTSEPGHDVRSIALGPELGQCCGGRVDLALEVFDRSRRDEVARLAAAEVEGAFRTRAIRDGDGPLIREIDPKGTVPIGSVEKHGPVIEEGFGDDRRVLYLFGAGHVGRALVLALAPLPFDVVWVDPRPESFPSHVPGNVRCVQAGDPASVLEGAADGAFALIMTHNHALDLSIVHKALDTPTLAYIGLIGSATKRARFASQLAQAGVPKEDVARVVTPIGLPGIHSKLPAVIAASVTADMLTRDEALRLQARDDANASYPTSTFAMRGS
ncbi:xanthine dehydrogenase accessory protein XdhC [Kaistia dalseonensis]|uniref:Xanthine dehydrogenase accessory factor n=1 Tax=Kaistia dalseonensis TaxID=410840 RepID=A0ABU0H2M0_9HYPH|nr:xanthine dehydrogenase accessory protein XdhC [Kaistia dalseonensis]MCX5493972.1 xanthine dehydrogenase accessory protein XdhC [Kaistia dalseonensis]MDQ0436548.1 xanthine dehydrogenase accessory factor [Kaistia dalseonensis]